MQIGSFENENSPGQRWVRDSGWTEKRKKKKEKRAGYVGLSGLETGQYEALI